MKLSLKFGILYSLFGGIAFESGFINLINNLEPNPNRTFPILQPFTKYTFIISLLIGFILLVIQIHMVFKKSISFKDTILSIIIGCFGSYFFSFVWIQGIRWISVLKRNYQLY